MFALLVPTTWEAAHIDTFLLHFSFEAIACAFFCAAIFTSSYRATAAGAVARSARHGIISEAAQSQALLETAMPPAVARALLEGAPPESLTRSFESASIAFVALEDFKTLGTGDPAALLGWLDRVYTAFDGLVDAYANGVSKVRVYAS
jgi:hypothetical protein